MNRFERWLYQTTFSAEDRIEIYDNFRQYLLDGLSAEDTFNKLIENYTRRGKKPNNAIGKILKECRDNIRAGFSLAQSLREWIPDQELSIIDSCDTAGKVAEGFLNAMLIAEGTSRIISAVRASLMITGYMFSLMAGIIFLFCILLIPVLKQTVPLTQWNGIQLSVYYFYLTITNYYWLLIIIFCTGGYLIKKSLSSWTGNIRFYFDKLPPTLSTVGCKVPLLFLT